MRWPDTDGLLRLALWLSWVALLGIVLGILHKNGYF